MNKLLELFMMRRLNFWSISCAMDKSFCIHHENIQRLLIEIYKAFHDIFANSLKEIFVKRESITSLRSKTEFVISSVDFVFKSKISLRP